MEEYIYIYTYVIFTSVHELTKTAVHPSVTIRQSYNFQGFINLNFMKNEKC